MIRNAFFASAAAAALAAMALATPAHAQAAPPEFSDYVAALQGEWVTRFCQKDFRWMVTGRTVTMAKQSAPTMPEADYDNRYAVGAKVMEIGDVISTAPTGIMFDVTSYEPDGSQDAPGTRASITYTPKGDYSDIRYFRFLDMIRPAVKAQQCT